MSRPSSVDTIGATCGAREMHAMPVVARESCEALGGKCSDGALDGAVVGALVDVLDDDGQRVARALDVRLEAAVPAAAACDLPAPATRKRRSAR